VVTSLPVAVTLSPEAASIEIILISKWQKLWIDGMMIYYHKRGEQKPLALMATYDTPDSLTTVVCSMTMS